MAIERLGGVLAVAPGLRAWDDLKTGRRAYRLRDCRITALSRCDEQSQSSLKVGRKMVTWMTLCRVDYSFTECRWLKEKTLEKPTEKKILVADGPVAPPNAITGNTVQANVTSRTVLSPRYCPEYLEDIVAWIDSPLLNNSP